MNDVPSHLLGWVDSSDRHLVAASLGPPLSQVAPHLFGAAVPDTILLYKAWKDVLGSYPSYPAQQIGDCTSFGSGHTVDLLQCIQIATGKQPITYKEICTEAIYGMGREIAGMLGPPGPRSDGCYGSAVAKAVMQGVIPRETVGPYSGKRAGEWGWHGVPADIKTKAAEHPVKSTAMITTCDDLDAALANGYPVIVCSNQGFTIERDADGVCTPRGSWAHCMGFSGRRIRNGRRQYCIDQSWGTNNGPPGPYGPLSDDQPPFSFWADEQVVGSMLAARDSFAFSGVVGFPGQVIPSRWSYDGFA